MKETMWENKHNFVMKETWETEKLFMMNVFGIFPNGKKIMSIKKPKEEYYYWGWNYMPVEEV